MIRACILKNSLKYPVHSFPVHLLLFPGVPSGASPGSPCTQLLLLGVRSAELIASTPLRAPPLRLACCCTFGREQSCVGRIIVLPFPAHCINGACIALRRGGRHPFSSLAWVFDGPLAFLAMRTLRRSSWHWQRRALCLKKWPDASGSTRRSRRRETRNLCPLGERLYRSAPVCAGERSYRGAPIHGNILITVRDRGASLVSVPTTSVTCRCA